MKRINQQVQLGWQTIPQGAIASLLLVTGLCVFHTAGRAAVPLPDHIVYGTISLGGQAVTKANTNIVVEARRPLDGLLLASYRMGTSARLGDFLYELRLKVEDTPDLLSDHAQLGETLNILVQDPSRVLVQTNHQILGAGIAVRLDFGPAVDANQNGVPDDWELANLGSNSVQLDADPDGDGTSNRYEYVAGTNPRDATDAFRLEVTADGAGLHVRFLARAATGPGYQGRSRYYALETNTSMSSADWRPLDNLSRITGNDQVVTYQPARTSTGPQFFRARVWLEGP